VVWLYQQNILIYYFIKSNFNAKLILIIKSIDFKRFFYKSTLNIMSGTAIFWGKKGNFCD